MCIRDRVSSANVSVISIGSGINAHNYTTGAFGLTMAGPGNLTLTAGGNYSVTTVTNGILKLGPAAALLPNSTVAGAAGTPVSYTHLDVYKRQL